MINVNGTAYLDHAATTPVRAEAAAAMMPWLTERYGNPSGSHALARQARAAVDDARDVVAAALGVPTGGVIFTSSGTEADNLALLGVSVRSRGAVVTTAVEHHAVLHAAEARGVEVRRVAVDADGVVDLGSLFDVLDVLDGDVALVSVMLVNNEVGTIQPLDAVADLVGRRAPRAVLHTDAVQAMPWLDVAGLASGADLISISAHKFGGPQGVGALGLRDAVELSPIHHGGGQERDRRSGTHNVAGIVGMAAALCALRTEVLRTEALGIRDHVSCQVRAKRDRLADGLLARVPRSTETGDRMTKAPGHCHLRFEGVESESLLLLLDDAGVYASAGSACASGALEPSHVLLAMGIPAEEALGSLRMTLGHATTDEEIDLALTTVPAAVARLREA